MHSALFEGTDNSQSVSIDERRYREPSVIDSGEPSTSNEYIKRSVKSFVYSQKKNNLVVKIKLNLKLAEQIRKIQRLKATFE